MTTNTLVKLIDVPGAGLGLLPLAVADRDVALANLPELGTLINAGWPSGRGLKNLGFLGGGALEPPGVNTVSLGTMAGGTRPAIDVPLTTKQRLNSPVALNPDEWTIFFAVEFSGVTAVARDILRAEGTFASGYAPRIVLSATDQCYMAVNTGSGVRINAGVLSAGVPHFVVFTMSAEQGLAAWVDGVRVAHNPADANPFSDGFAAGGWNWARQNTGDGYLRLGWCGHCNVDLSRLRYSADGAAGHLARITAFMKAEYGIA